MVQELICPVANVKVSIPRKRIIKLFYEHRRLTKEETAILRSKKREFEENITSLQHSLSIVERILLRT